MATIKRRTLFYIVLAIILAASVLFLYRYGVKLGKIASPFLMAGIIAYLITPLVKRLESKGISRRVSILLVYLLFSLIIASVIVFLIPELANNTKELINTIPDIISGIQNMVQNFLSLIRSSRWPADIKNTIFGEIQTGVAVLQNYLMDALKKSLMTIVTAVTSLFDLVLAMIIAYYFIKDKELFRAAFVSLTPKKWRNEIITAGREINQLMSNFIQGQLLVALIVGVLETIGLLLVQIKYPLVLGLIGGLANIIPYFGPILGAVPAVAVALIQSPVKALWTALVFVVVQQLDNAFISSKVIEGKMGLHPVTTILAVLVGGEFFGIPGMFIAVPVVAVLKVIGRRVIEAVV
ncbi:MAG: AI-2E family transporter [Clostridiales bacterium]|jgi:predicted PurR-regulated permease PerM|nr:AI-2E family transporter [Eubacteriales bacterium]MDH7565520.1 AI-2E family transporter [Clostridiales bacterium]